METAYIRALNNYRDAVQSRVFWQDHGTNGDGKLEQAIKNESRRREELHGAVKSLASLQSSLEIDLMWD